MESLGPASAYPPNNLCNILNFNETKRACERHKPGLAMRYFDAAVERGPERVRQRNAAKELLWKGLESIGTEHREILVLKELEGFRYAEIALILDIPEGTVASRLYHARTALKCALTNLDAEYF